ncbi:DUF808 domain-containing protein [Algibacillus agarilyticus]|uniref:DUF808 domain-containing protein n=1 Tax=Algibacillus agarilyticus TaxID=2234133 RepID=UPI000DD0ACEA|nr:DUF808 domain-containing protein [Algibacillus agarilyticus]
MAGASLLTLLDDIASVLDDVAAMTKVAARKTAGVLGDDLALNAEQVSGVRAERELPVVWAVAKGSALNKVIIVPIALMLSAFLPWLITPLLMLGGAYLCFEGVEKIAHKFFHAADNAQAKNDLLAAVADQNIDLVALEKEKIKGAIKTDFILSAEIIVIALGTVQDATLLMQAAVLVGISAVMTIGVYGLVAVIVKLDDAGYYLISQPKLGIFGVVKHSIGRGLLAFAPRLMKLLTIVGTAAMFLVGGGIVVHGWPWLHHLIEAGLTWFNMAGISMIWQFSWPLIANAMVGIVVGALVLAIVSTLTKLKATRG